MKRYLSILFSALFLLFASHTAAQGDDDGINEQIWLDYNPRLPLGNLTSLYGDLGFRTNTMGDWYRFNFRLGFNIKPFNLSERAEILRTLQIHAGVGDFYTVSGEDVNLNEFRIYQGIRVYWPVIRRVTFSHYLRMEERFENLLKEERVDISGRLRYQLGARIRFGNLYIPLTAEIFFPIWEGVYFNDVIRATPGIGYDFTDTFRAQLNVSYHFSRNSPDDSFQNNDLVFRIRVYHIL